MVQKISSSEMKRYFAFVSDIMKRTDAIEDNLMAFRDTTVPEMQDVINAMLPTVGKLRDYLHLLDRSAEKVRDHGAVFPGAQR